MAFYKVRSRAWGLGDSLPGNFRASLCGLRVCWSTCLGLLVYTFQGLQASESTATTVLLGSVLSYVPLPNLNPTTQQTKNTQESL